MQLPACRPLEDFLALGRPIEVLDGIEASRGCSRKLAARLSRSVSLDRPGRTGDAGQRTRDGYYRRSGASACALRVIGLAPATGLRTASNMAMVAAIGTK